MEFDCRLSNLNGRVTTVVVNLASGHGERTGQFLGTTALYFGCLERPSLTIHALYPSKAASVAVVAQTSTDPSSGMEETASLGVTYQPHKNWDIGLRGRYFGARPLIEDNSERAAISTLLNAQLPIDTFIPLSHAVCGCRYV